MCLLAGSCGPAILDILSAMGRVAGTGWSAVRTGLLAGAVAVGGGPVAGCPGLCTGPVVASVSSDVPF